MSRSDLLLKNISLIYIAFCLPKIVVSQNGEEILSYEWISQEAKEVFDDLNKEYVEIRYNEMANEYVLHLRKRMQERTYDHLFDT